MKEVDTDPPNDDSEGSPKMKVEDCFVGGFEAAFDLMFLPWLLGGHLILWSRVKKLYPHFIVFICSSLQFKSCRS